MSSVLHMHYSHISKNIRFNLFDFFIIYRLYCVNRNIQITHEIVCIGALSYSIRYRFIGHIIKTINNIQIYIIQCRDMNGKYIIRF